MDAPDGEEKFLLFSLRFGYEYEHINFKAFGVVVILVPPPPAENIFTISNFPLCRVFMVLSSLPCSHLAIPVLIL